MFLGPMAHFAGMGHTLGAAGAMNNAWGPVAEVVGIGLA